MCLCICMEIFGHPIQLGDQLLESYIPLGNASPYLHCKCHLLTEPRTGTSSKVKTLHTAAGMFLASDHPPPPFDCPEKKPLHIGYLQHWPCLSSCH